MQKKLRSRILVIVMGLPLVGCTDHAPTTASAPVAEKPAAAPIVESSGTQFAPELSEAPAAESAPAPSEIVGAESDPPVDPAEVERRFLAAGNNPVERIAAIRELANATPAAALTTLNRLFPIERREDVKSEMLAALGELDHTKDRDNQLALCSKALAPDQPQRIRYLAIHLLLDLGDPRARSYLTALEKDPDAQIRAAARHVLGNLEP